MHAKKPISTTSLLRNGVVMAVSKKDIRGGAELILLFLSPLSYTHTHSLIGQKALLSFPFLSLCSTLCPLLGHVFSLFTLSQSELNSFARILTHDDSQRKFPGEHLHRRASPVCSLILQKCVLPGIDYFPILSLFGSPSFSPLFIFFFPKICTMCQKNETLISAACGTSVEVVTVQFHA